MKYSIYEPIEITAYLENEIMSASPKKRMQYIFEINKQQQAIIDCVLPNPKFTPEGEEKPCIFVPIIKKSAPLDTDFSN